MRPSQNDSGAWLRCSPSVSATAPTPSPPSPGKFLMKKTLNICSIVRIKNLKLYFSIKTNIKINTNLTGLYKYDNCDLQVWSQIIIWTVPLHSVGCSKFLCHPVCTSYIWSGEGKGWRNAKESTKTGTIYF